MLFVEAPAILCVLYNILDLSLTLATEQRAPLHIFNFNKMSKHPTTSNNVQKLLKEDRVEIYFKVGLCIYTAEQTRWKHRMQASQIAQ